MSRRWKIEDLRWRLVDEMHALQLLSSLRENGASFIQRISCLPEWDADKRLPLIGVAPRNPNSILPSLHGTLCTFTVQLFLKINIEVKMQK